MMQYPSLMTPNILSKLEAVQFRLHLPKTYYAFRNKDIVAKFSN